MLVDVAVPEASVVAVGRVTPSVVSPERVEDEATVLISGVVVGSGSRVLVMLISLPVGTGDASTVLVIGKPVDASTVLVIGISVAEEVEFVPSRKAIYSAGRSTG